MTAAFTPEQQAELVAAMDAVMRMCGGLPNGAWREAAITHMAQHGASYDATLHWLSQCIGTCGSSGSRQLPDFQFGSLSLQSEVKLYSSRLGQHLTVQRGTFLRAVFPDPTKAQQLLLF